MPENSEPRVAVYLDFDNIVISRYDQVHGRGQFMRDRPRIADAARGDDPEISAKLKLATVDIGAVIDFAASFGTLVLTRAYADWSAPVNADYRQQLVARAIDLVQLFPAAAYAKNGADIRLAVDAVEDMFRLPDLTHVVIVAGDSDYIALAQRCKRLGRYVIGIGVAGSTSKALAAACDEFDTYDSLPGVPAVERPAVRAAVEAAAAAAATPAESAEPAADAAPPKKSATRRGSGKTAAQKAADKKAAEAASADASLNEVDVSADASTPPSAPSKAATSSKKAAAASIEAALDAAVGRATKRGAAAPADEPAAAAEVEADGAAEPAEPAEPAAPAKRAPRRASSRTVATAAAEPDASVDDEPAEDPQDVATKLLERALQLGHGKDDAEWLHSSAVKTHMKRMDPSFSEKALGFRSFSDFVKARESIAELEETGHERLVRQRQS